MKRVYLIKAKNEIYVCSNLKAGKRVFFEFYNEYFRKYGEPRRHEDEDDWKFFYFTDEYGDTVRLCLYEQAIIKG